MSKTITVGISDLNIALAPDILATYALGSCVGICLYDCRNKIAGLAHIMLPWSADSKSAGENSRRFADTGIAELANMMQSRGADFRCVTAKIAGGAQMFATTSAVFNIGERNVEAVKKVLNKFKIPIVAEETGKNFGRTVFFDAATGEMQIKSATKQTVLV